MNPSLYRIHSNPNLNPGGRKSVGSTVESDPIKLSFSPGSTPRKEKQSPALALKLHEESIAIAESNNIKPELLEASKQHRVKLKEAMKKAMQLEEIAKAMRQRKSIGLSTSSPAPRAPTLTLLINPSP